MPFRNTCYYRLVLNPHIYTYIVTYMLEQVGIGTRQNNTPSDQSCPIEYFLYKHYVFSKGLERPDVANMWTTQHSLRPTQLMPTFNARIIIYFIQTIKKNEDIRIDALFTTSKCSLMTPSQQLNLCLHFRYIYALQSDYDSWLTCLYTTNHRQAFRLKYCTRQLYCTSL